MAMRKNLPLAIGLPAYERGLERLDEERRLAFLSTMATGWVPLTIMDAVLTAMAEAAATTVPELHAELTRLGMRKATSGVWRLAVTLRSDEKLLERTAFLFRKTYNRGQARAQRLGDNAAQVVVIDWPKMPDYPIRGLQVGIQTLIELSGRNGVLVRHLRTTDGAKFHVSWQQ
jgi:hypothetical protein